MNTKELYQFLNEGVLLPNNRYLEVGINVNIDDVDWLSQIFSTVDPKTIETRDYRSYSQWKSYEGQYVGLVLTHTQRLKTAPEWVRERFSDIITTRGHIPTGVLVGYALVEEVIPYHQMDRRKFTDDEKYHKVNSTNGSFSTNRIGLRLNDIHILSKAICLKSDGQRAVRRLTEK